MDETTILHSPTIGKRDPSPFPIPTYLDVGGGVDWPASLLIGAREERSLTRTEWVLTILELGDHQPNEREAQSQWG